MTVLVQLAPFANKKELLERLEVLEWISKNPSILKRLSRADLKINKQWAKIRKPKKR